MGDRATVVFAQNDRDGRYFSPGVYLHWNGAPERVKELLEKAAPVLRKGDVGYSAARFCGVCHVEIGGDVGSNLGLGLCGAPDTKRAYDDFEYWGFKGYGPGDNGVYIVDVDDLSVIQIDGWEKTIKKLDVDLSAVRE